jgi:putative addiction module component (TIGR02574 family)
MSLESLGIDRLSLDEKIELAHDLWESIAADAELSPLTDEQKQMLDRRIAELDADPSIALTWDQIKSRVLNGE